MDIDNIFKKAESKKKEKKQQEVENEKNSDKVINKVEVNKKKKIKKKNDKKKGKKEIDGLKVYTTEELNLGKGGDTPDCPFDCECCY